MTVDGELLALSARLGATLREASRMPWGDANGTWLLRLDDGRDVVGRRFAQGSAAPAERQAAITHAVSGVGIPVPEVRLIEIEGTRWLVSNRVEGAVGATWLDTPERARALATAMGTLRVRLLEIDRSAANESLTSPTAGRPAAGAAAGQADEAAESILRERRVEDVLVHGDFAPINVILDGEGAVRALLDWEHTHLGDPLEDAAWWCWVVRHHHPHAWRAAWPIFCAAAGVDPVVDGPIIHALMLRELGRRAAAAEEAQVAIAGWSTWPRPLPGEPDGTECSPGTSGQVRDRLRALREGHRSGHRAPPQGVGRRRPGCRLRVRGGPRRT